jgi:hypothetical protein
VTHAAASTAAHDERADAADTPVWKAMLLLVAALVVLGTALTAVSLGAASIFS